MIRVASYNVENLFSRPKAFDGTDWSIGEPILAAFHEVNVLLGNVTYSNADKQRIRDLFVTLDIYRLNQHGAARRVYSSNPRWAWFRKNRGSFDRQPQDSTQDVVITADGRDDWIGWVELAKEPTDEFSTRLTARVITDIAADIIGIVEAEDRPSLVRFNKEMLNGFYEHVMLIDGNDTRGIDVGVMARGNFEIDSIISNVDTVDGIGTVFSRDCPQYEICTPAGVTIHVLVNHFKSQSGGGGDKRQRQAAEVRRIVDRLVSDGQHVIVLGDLNEGPTAENTQAANFSALFENDSPLVDSYSLTNMELGNRPGTFNSCGIRNRLDYILISQSLVPHFSGGQIYRKGLWGTRKTRPDKWSTYPEMTESSQQASDHAAVFIDLDL
jgi:endonuclease/exonuclease/phosphatase family metal-dependent hydrolase